MQNPVPDAARAQARAQIIVWWTLWAAFQTSPFLYNQFLSAPNSHSPVQPVDSPAWLAAFAPFVISAIIRWFILPRIRIPQTALAMFVVGIAMSESLCFMGIYVFSAHRQELLIWSILGILQFIPYFASRYTARIV